MDVRPGDILMMKKEHPCKNKEFLVLRAGMDFRIRCTKCGREIMAPRAKIEKNCKELKEHKADKVIVCCTFGLFTNGLEKFDEYYHQGYLDYVITTNLNYRTQELIDREWYLEADMSKYLAAVINSMNHDRSISASLSPTEKIQKLVQKRQNGGYEYFQKLV